jgi:hypothetical protein
MLAVEPSDQGQELWVVLCHRPDERGPGNAVRAAEGVFELDLDQDALDDGIQGGAKRVSHCLQIPSYANP